MFFLIFALIIPNTSLGEEARKKVAVVLSGGGAKGMAHIGALRVIEEAGIPIDIIVGTSMGSIIGGLYSIGYTPDQIDEMVNAQDWTYVLSDKIKREEISFVEKKRAEKYVLSVPFAKNPKESIGQGIVKGQNLANLFSELTRGYHDSIDFNDLPVKYACVAVDIVTGDEIVFHNGYLQQAMRASMSIPGVFEPVKIDGKVLVDGGLKNNYPVNVAKEMGADIIIGVDVQSPLKTEEELISVGDILGQIVGVYCQSSYDEAIENTDIYIKVDVEGYSAASFSKSAIDSLRSRGDYAAREKLSDLLLLKEDLNLNNDTISVKNSGYKISSNNMFYVRDIVFKGGEPKEEEHTLKRCSLKENELISTEQIKDAISILYGTMSYSSVTYQLISIGDNKYDLHFFLDEKKDKIFSLGLKLDTEEFISILMNGLFNMKTQTPSQIDVFARLGVRTSVGVNYILEPWMMTWFNFSYTFNYNDYDLYFKGKKFSNYTCFNHQIEAGFSDVWKQKLLFSCGVRYNFFDYKNRLLPENTPLEYKPKTEDYISYFGSLQYDSFNEYYYPTKGQKGRIDYSLYTDNSFSYRNDFPFSALALSWQGVFSPTKRISVLPTLYFRYVWGNDNIPFTYKNMLGGNMFGRYTNQQIPFYGVRNAELMQDGLAVLRLSVRQRIVTRNYVTLSGNVALSDHNLVDVIADPDLSILGGGITYGYKTVFGPIEATISYSNRINRPYFFINAGFEF